MSSSFVTSEPGYVFILTVVRCGAGWLAALADDDDPPLEPQAASPAARNSARVASVAILEAAPTPLGTSCRRLVSTAHPRLPPPGSSNRTEPRPPRRSLQR